MKIVTNSSHDYKVGKYYITVNNFDLVINDTSDNQRVVLNESMDTDQMKGLAKAIYLGAIIREESQNLLREELQAEADEELRNIDADDLEVDFMGGI